MELVRKIEALYDSEKKKKKKFKICNFSFNENYKNLPNLSFLLRNSPCNYNKQRAPQVVLKFKMSQYTKNKYETPLSIIISQKKSGNEHLIKFIGANNTWKVIFGTQIAYEYMCDMVNPLTGRLVFWDIDNSDLRIVNGILKWTGVKNIKDFDVMSRELKHKVKFYNTKFPQIIIPSLKKTCPFKFNCNLSYKGIGTATNLKNYEQISYIKNYVNEVITSIGKGDEENLYIGKIFTHEHEQYVHDKRQFYNCLLLNNVEQTFFITKVKFYGERYIHYVSTRKIFKYGEYPSLDFIKKNTENYLRLYPGQYENLVKIYGLRETLFTIKEIDEA